MPIFVDKASASSIECVVKITALFLSRCDIFSTTDHMKRRASGSMPAEGSSKRIIGGLPTMATATYNFLFHPPDRVPEGDFLWGSSLSCLMQSSTTCLRLLAGTPFILAKNHRCSSTVIKSKIALCYGQ